MSSLYSQSGLEVYHHPVEVKTPKEPFPEEPIPVERHGDLEAIGGAQILRRWTEEGGLGESEVGKDEKLFLGKSTKFWLFCSLALSAVLVGVLGSLAASRSRTIAELQSNSRYVDVRTSHPSGPSTNPFF
jgi:hypothetical protein